MVDRLRENGQIALTYRVSAGEDDQEPGAAEGAYPANPNGSVLDIAGICNEKGNVLGLMPHPERFVHRLQAPSWTRNPPDASESTLESLHGQETVSQSSPGPSVLLTTGPIKFDRIPAPWGSEVPGPVFPGRRRELYLLVAQAVGGRLGGPLSAGPRK